MPARVQLSVQWCCMPSFEDSGEVRSRTSFLPSSACLCHTASFDTMTLQGRIKVPSCKEMAADVAKCTSWRRSFMPATPSLAGKLVYLCQGYHDELVTDMGESKWRKVSLC